MSEQATEFRKMDWLGLKLSKDPIE